MPGSSTAFEVRPPDERAVGLGQALGLLAPTAASLCARGIDTPEKAGPFLAPRLADLRAPGSMAGFPQAIERLARAVLTSERIGVFGDYDVDGVTTASLLTLALRALGGTALPRIARRDAGYGFGEADAVALADEGCRLIVTGDCGTSDRPALELCRARGIDCIVIDHHQVPDGRLPVVALLNPHQPGCAFPFKGFASVGIAFCLMAALRTRLREDGVERAALFDPRGLLDLVALGTIADLAPLHEENRTLVAAGLAVLGRRDALRPGLAALCGLAALEGDRPLRATDVSFRLAPRLNAPGRLGDARPALNLLLAGDDEAAALVASECEAANQRRRELQDLVYQEAEAQVVAMGDAPAYVVAGEGWNAGVVGIVAAKLVERTRRPVAVVALDGAVGRGSVRTAGGLHLYRALEACAEHLVRFGGHAGAAGLTIEASRVTSFREAFAAHAAMSGSPAREHERACDAVIQLEDLDLRLCEETARLAPFGVGNPEPVYLIEACIGRRLRIVGERHLALALCSGSQEVDAIAFGAASRFSNGELVEGAAVRVAVTPELDLYRGVRRARARVVDIEPIQGES